MTAPAQVPPSSPKARWLWLALAGLLAGFTLLCWRDADRSPWRPAAGGTFKAIYRDLLVNGSRNQYCDGMFNRLKDVFSDSERRLAREILKAACRSHDGLSR